MRVIHLARKPLIESVAVNTLKHGCGGLNICASRIHTKGEVMKGQTGGFCDDSLVFGGGPGDHKYTPSPAGRWPANVILQHLDGCRCEGVRKVRGGSPRDSRGREHSKYRFQGEGTGRNDVHPGFGGVDGMETVADWICVDGCPVAALDEQSGVTGSNTEGVNYRGEGGQFSTNIYGSAGPQGRMEETRRQIVDKGGASRFFKQVGGKTE